MNELESIRKILLPIRDKGFSVEENNGTAKSGKPVKKSTREGF